MKTYLVSFEREVYCQELEYIFDYCLVSANSEEEAYKKIEKKYPTARNFKNKTIYDFPVKGSVK